LESKGKISGERHEKAKKTQSVIKYEFQRIKPYNADLKKQADAVKALNDDIVRPVLEKRELEYGALSEEVSSTAKELEKATALLEELTEQYADLQSSYDSSMELLQDRRANETTVKNEPQEIQREIGMMNKKVITVQAELLGVQNQVSPSKAKVLAENTTRMRMESIQREVVKMLDGQKQKCNRTNNEHESILKTVTAAQTNYHSLTTARVHIEIHLREANEQVRHEGTAAAMQRKQLDRMMRLYLKKNRITVKVREVVEELKVKLKEDTAMIKTQEMVCRDQYQLIESMKDDINIKITRVLEQKNVEDETKIELETLIADTEGAESEIDRWRTEVKKLGKILSVLGNQRDIQIQRTKSTVGDEKDAKDLLKLKTYVVLEMCKVFSETNKRAKEFGALYESLKREKNEIVAASSASSLALAEVRERIDSGAIQVHKLRCAQEVKRNVLTKEKDSHESSKISRAMLRVEKTNARELYMEKREEEDRQVGKIDKLKSILGSLQRDDIQLKSSNKRLATRSRLMSDQLGDKKIEVHSLLQRANIHEETLKRGELAIQQKKEDIRAIKIHVSPCTLMSAIFCK